MARPRKPIALHEASGAMAKNPQRFRNRICEPKVHAALGPPPQEWLDRAPTSPENRKLVAAWHEICGYIALLPPDTVTGADRATVKLACRLHVRIEGGYAKTSEIAQYRACLRDLALTAPGRAQRAGPMAPGDPNDGDFGEFRAKLIRRIA